MGLRRTLQPTMAAWAALLSGGLLLIAGLTLHTMVDRGPSLPAGGTVHSAPATGCYGDPAQEAVDYSEVAVRGVARQTRTVPPSGCVPALRAHDADGHGAVRPGGFAGRSRGLDDWTAGEIQVHLRVFRR